MLELVGNTTFYMLHPPCVRMVQLSFSSVSKAWEPASCTANRGGRLPSTGLCGGANRPCMLSCIKNSNCNHSLHRHRLTAMAEAAAPAVAAAVDSGEAPAAAIMASGSIRPARTTPGAARARAASSSIQVRGMVDVRLELASGVGDGQSVVGHLVVAVQQGGAWLVIERQVYLACQMRLWQGCIQAACRSGGELPAGQAGWTAHAASHAWQVRMVFLQASSGLLDARCTRYRRRGKVTATVQMLVTSRFTRLFSPRKLAISRSRAIQ